MFKYIMVRAICICVGATINHTGYTDIEGKYKQSETLPIGALGAYSSIGPTFDERIKPNVIAPGSTVISSYNSFYEVCHPDNWDRDTRISSYIREEIIFGIPIVVHLWHLRLWEELLPYG